MLVDPSASLWTDGPRRTVWAYEVCDVVEDDKIDFNGVQMSDFVYPAYFDMFRLKKGAKQAQYDYLKKVKRPFQILDGGYSDVHENGEVKTKWGSAKKKNTSCGRIGAIIAVNSAENGTSRVADET